MHGAGPSRPVTLDPWELEACKLLLTPGPARDSSYSSPFASGQTVEVDRSLGGAGELHIGQRQQEPSNSSNCGQQLQTSAGCSTTFSALLTAAPDEHLTACSHQGSNNSHDAYDIATSSRCIQYRDRLWPAGPLHDQQAACAKIHARTGDQLPGPAVHAFPDSSHNLSKVFNHTKTPTSDSSASMASWAAQCSTVSTSAKPVLSAQTIQDDIEKRILAAASAAATDAATAFGQTSDAEDQATKQARYGERAKLSLRSARRGTKRPKAHMHASLTAQVQGKLGKPSVQRKQAVASSRPRHRELQMTAAAGSLEHVPAVQQPSGGPTITQSGRSESI